METDYTSYIPLLLIVVLSLIQIAIRFSPLLARGKRSLVLAEVVTPEQLRRSQLVVYLWSDYCMFCNTAKPVVEQLSREFQDAIVSLDAVRHNKLATELGARAVPAFVFLKQGTVVKTHIGVLPATTIRKFLQAGI